MEDHTHELLQALQDAAYSNIRYCSEYITLCRRTGHSFQELWNSFTKKQKKLFLRFEEDSNARSAAEEKEIIRQVFLLTRELYR